MKNWKTTLSGVVSAAAMFVVFAGQNGLTMPHWATVTASFVLMGGLASMGLAAKDSNVTGGTTPATAEAAARVAPDNATAEAIKELRPPPVVSPPPAPPPA